MGISRTTVLLPGIALAAAIAASPAWLQARAGGTIVGTLSTKEAARPALRVTIDPGVCGTSVPDDSIAVDAAGHLANGVITVTGVKAPAPAEAVVNNEKCRFVPRVSLIKPAGNVKVVNKDPAPVLHTTHAQMSDGKFLFNVSLPFPNFSTTKPIDKPGLVELACNTHTWMRGYLVVTDELSVVSGADGKFKIEGVPAGPHDLKIWHESLKVAMPVKVTVKDGETVTVDVTLVK
jgi:plastocyanin